LSDEQRQTIIDVNAPASAPDSALRKRRSRDQHKKDKNKRPRPAFRLDFADTDKLSPVSGTVILPPDSGGENSEGVQVTGDIDSSLNCVEVTAEARAELDKIDNRIGDYICRLCSQRYEDAFRYRSTVLL